MSPIKTPKYDRALAHLEKLGLIPSAIHALADAGPDALYRELSRRGYVWSGDLNVWRKTKKPRRVPAAIVKSGYLNYSAVRLIVQSEETDYAIAEFSSVMANFGYDVTRVAVHGGRNEGEVLIYCTLCQADHSDG